MKHTKEKEIKIVMLVNIEKPTISVNSFHEYGFIPICTDLFFSSSVIELKQTITVNTNKLSTRSLSRCREHELIQSFSPFIRLEDVESGFSSCKVKKLYQIRTI